MKSIDSAKVRCKTVGRVQSSITSKKAAFTLLEILVCISILALFLSATARYCKSGYDTWCYQKTVRRLEQKLDVASVLAKVTNNSVDVIFKKVGNDIVCLLRPCQEVSQALCGQLQKEERLDAVQDLVVNQGQKLFGDMQTKKWRLTIYPQGIDPASATRLTLVPWASIASTDIDFDEKKFLIQCIEDEKAVLKFFPEELQADVLAP